MAKAKERAHISLSVETTQALLRAKAAQERRNLSNKQMFSKIVGAFSEAEEWDFEALAATETQRRAMASGEYRINPGGQKWRELADQSGACGQTLEIVSGDVDALRKLEKTLGVEIPELHAYDQAAAEAAWPKTQRVATRAAITKRTIDVDALAS